ncbi:MAG: hypothetical protein FJW40_06805, partial [Acidobacteria bacterium]|nr:hypothetical protein [Acidobacteriota bacterium]
MPDYSDPREAIRQQLLRTVIAEPLATDITDHPDVAYEVIIDINAGYAEGREEAFTPHFRFEPRVRISWMLVRINIDRGLKAAKTPAEDSTQWVTN